METNMKSLANVAKGLVPAKARRLVQHAQFMLGDRRELAHIRPPPIPFGYERIYHFHIRKTAGSSLNFAFRNAILDGFPATEKNAAFFRRNWAVHAGRVYITHNKYLIERGEYFYGDGHAAFHEVNIPPNTFMITILRDPLRRILSHYRMLMHWKHNGIDHPAKGKEQAYLGTSFADFLDRVPRNHLMRQLYMFSERMDVAEAVENISKMNFIMMTESFSQHLQRLGSLLQLDLRPFAEKASYGAVDEPGARERERLAGLLAPEYELLRAVAPLAGVHLVDGRPVETERADRGAAVFAET